MERMRERLSKGDSLFSVADRVTKESGYLAQLKQEAEDEKDGPKSWQRLDNLDELLGSIATFETASKTPSLSRYLQQVALVQDGENPKSKNSVSLLTMHAAKGLEFPVVFVIGCVAGIVPHSMSIDEGREGEERRLFYVALTRAKDHLHVSSFEAKKFGRGGTRYFDPSYFIQETMEKPLAEVTS
jgi:DNA helicase-2/ATP-dependent DNA helicase PcrA